MGVKVERGEVNNCQRCAVVEPEHINKEVILVAWVEAERKKAVGLNLKSACLL